VLLSLKDEVKTVDASQEKIRQHQKAVLESQERLRKNLTSLQKLSQTAKLVERYLQDLSDDEDRLREGQKTVETLSEKKRQLTETLAEQRGAIRDTATSALGLLPHVSPPSDDGDDDEAVDEEAVGVLAQ